MEPFYIRVKFGLVLNVLSLKIIVFEKAGIIDRSFFGFSDFLPKFIREVFFFVENALVFAKPIY